MFDFKSSNSKPPLFSKRDIVQKGTCSILAAIFCAQKAFAKPSAKSINDDYAAAFALCLSPPPAKFINLEIDDFSNKKIYLRFAVPYIFSGKLPLIICCPDSEALSESYDIMTGAVCARGYILLTILSEEINIPPNVEPLAFKSMRRALNIRLALDKLNEISLALGADRNKIDINSIGVAGHGEGAWTALELIGWGRGLIPNFDLADARIKSAFALNPSNLSPSLYAKRKANNNASYGRGLIAGDLNYLPTFPEGSGLFALGLPPVRKGFGGILGKFSNRNRKIEADKPQTEMLAASLAAAGLFFDWSLKNQKSRIYDLAGLDGRVIPQTNNQMTFTRA